MRSLSHSPARRLIAFSGVLVAVFALAALAGAAAGPQRVEAERAGGHDMSAAGGHDMSAGGHDMSAPSHGSAAPSGLAVTQDGYRLVLGQTAWRAGASQTLRFQLLDPAGRPLHAFDIEHGARLHLIVVRRDLNGYQHLHPRLGADGTWSIPLTLPTPGAYRVYADFHTAGRALTLGSDLLVPGDFRPRALPAASTVASADGYAVELSEPTPGMLHFTVRRGGREVTDLQPYLGARGHLVALREGDLAYLHVHPEEGPTPGAGISFHAELPSAGRYRLFLQFSHGGRVHTVAYTRVAAR